MEEDIYVKSQNGRFVKKGFEKAPCPPGIPRRADCLAGVLKAITEDENIDFLRENCVVDACYKAHYYRLRPVGREGLFRAWLAVRPEPFWPI